MREKRRAFRIMVGTPGGVRLLGRPRNRLEECLETCVGVMGWEWCGFLWLRI
jgi:hypothetical protein